MSEKKTCRVHLELVIDPITVTPIISKYNKVIDPQFIVTLIDLDNKYTAIQLQDSMCWVDESIGSVMNKVKTSLENAHFVPVDEPDAEDFDAWNASYKAIFEPL